MSPTVHRWLVTGLVVAAAIVVAVTVLASVDGDGGFAWHCGGGALCVSPKRGGHIYLRPLAHPLLGSAVAAGFFAVAAQLAVTHGVLRIASQAAAAIAAVVAVLLGLAFAFVGSIADVSREAVVATSPNFKLVSYRSSGFFSSGRILLRLQSREGLASRESSDDLACFIEENSGAGPEWLFAQASFVGNDQIALSAKDGTTWQVHFNTQTLSAVNPLDRCTEAPDPAAD